MSRSTRHPTWSGALTGPLAAVIPVEHRALATRVIKAIHTAAFAVISAAILVFTWDGLQGRWGRRAQLAAAIAITETVVYASNDQVCPLTPLAEALGEESGAVTDLYRLAGPATGSPSSVDPRSWSGWPCTSSPGGDALSAGGRETPGSRSSVVDAADGRPGAGEPLAIVGGGQPQADAGSGGQHPDDDVHDLQPGDRLPEPVLDQAEADDPDLHELEGGHGHTGDHGCRARDVGADDQGDEGHDRQDAPAGGQLRDPVSGAWGQDGTTTTAQVARRETSDETLPRMSRRTFRRGREPRTMTSAASAWDASRMASAGSPSQMR